MDSLIRITEKDGKQLVSARELHEFLGSKREFATWIKDRIKKYGFVENQDYSSFDEIVKRENGGNVLIQYALTIDCAKEIAMVEGNAKGKQARQYFIECEKQLKNQPITKELSRKDLILLALEAEKEKEALQIQNELQDKALKEQAPKVQFYDKVLNSNSDYTSTTIAKELGISAIEFHKIMHQRGVLFKQDGHWVLYAKYQDKGYTKTRTFIYRDSTGNEKSGITTTWTPKGREFIHEIFSMELVAN